MKLAEFESKVSRAVNAELEEYVGSAFAGSLSDLKGIFFYHLGLENNGNSGKRIRPLLTALCAAGAGADWEKSIPAACAIELIHNFSLIHDDIEDMGDLRRGRQAVWKKWGLAKGVNSGDAMFVSAFDILTHNDVLDCEKTLTCLQVLSNTCLFLTEGQELDIGFEQRDYISREEYFHMVEGKTAALIACCAKTGAIIGGLSLEEQNHFSEFGNQLGIAFQIQDDWLGIWGDPKITGKSASSDLLEKKKSYPVVLGFELSERFTTRWKSGSIKQEDIPGILEILENDGIKAMVEADSARMTKLAFEILHSLLCKVEVISMLEELTNKLLTRKN